MAADPQQLRADFRRYADLIAAQLGAAGGAFTPIAGSETGGPGGGGVVLADAVRDPAALGEDHPAVEQLIELAGSGAVASVDVVDASGQRRAMYRGVMIYAWLAAFRLRYESLSRQTFGRWDEALRTW